MADTKRIDQLDPSVLPLNDTDIFHGKQGALDKQVSGEQLKKALTTVSNVFTNTGTVNQFTLTPSGRTKIPDALFDGYTIEVTVLSSNTTAVTFLIGSFPVKALYADGVVLPSGYLQALETIVARYDLANDRFNIVDSSSFRKQRLLDLGLIDGTDITQATEAVRGTLEISSTAEAAGWTDDLTVITPLKLAQAFSGNNSLVDPGYQDFPGGLKVRWGKVVVDYDQTSTIVTFPLAFSNVRAIVATISRATTVTGVLTPFVHSPTSTQFEILGETDGTTVLGVDTYWIAIGD